MYTQTDMQMVERQFGYPNLERKIVLDVTRSGSNRKFSDARAYRVCRTVEGSVWRAILSMQMAKQLCLT